MITGENIRLRAVERADLPRFQVWLNDDEVTTGLLVSLPLSMEDEEAWFASRRSDPLDEHPLVIEARLGSGWAPIGNCGLSEIDYHAREAEVGIFIGEKSLWGRGYGTEAIELLLRPGFSIINLNRIFLRVHANNSRAIRSYEKAGFVHEGRQRQAAYKNGHYLDILMMSILRSEWNARHPESAPEEK